VLLQGFLHRILPACGVLVSAGVGNIPASLGAATRTYLESSSFGAPQEV
jgi:hypothetical protein